MLVVNLFGGPGVGKSTLAAQVYAELSKKGYAVEYVSEFAKDLIWSDCERLLQDQFLVAAQQHHRINRLKGKVDVVVTDSPSLLGIVYRHLWNDDKYSSVLDDLIWEVHTMYSRVNFVIPRCHQFSDNGRLHNEQQSQQVDNDIIALLNQHSQEQQYTTYLDVDSDWVATVLQRTCATLGRLKRP